MSTEFTERQHENWKYEVRNVAGTSHSIPYDTEHWRITFQGETKQGGGRDFVATYISDGRYYEIRMDAFGESRSASAYLEWDYGVYRNDYRRFERGW